MCIHLGTRTLFFAHIPNRKGYLEYLLERFFDAHKFFEHKIQTFYEDEHPNEKGIFFDYKLISLCLNHLQTPPKNSMISPATILKARHD